MLAKRDGLAYLIAEDERGAIKARHAGSEFLRHLFRQFIDGLAGDDGINLLRFNSARFERCFELFVHNHPFANSIQQSNNSFQSPDVIGHVRLAAPSPESAQVSLRPGRSPCNRVLAHGLLSEAAGNAKPTLTCPSKLSPIRLLARTAAQS